jgi:chemotaxis protein methyltransferase WspC
MRETGSGSEAEYVALASTDEREMDKLVEEVVVSETWFMRDRQPFAELARAASLHQGREPFRVLTLPCATGEEPFSVAITLLEAGLSAGFVVDAVDVSQRALLQASLGVFGERSFRADDGSLRRRWFTRVPTGWAIDPALQRHVTFRRGNVLDDGLGRGARYEAIFCRNLLIYLAADARTKAIRNLRRALSPGGTLFVGHAESLERMDPTFMRVGATSAFAYRAREVSPETGRYPLVEANKTSNRMPPLAIGSTRPASAQHVATGKQPVFTDPALSGSTQALVPEALREARSLADRGRLDEAQALCERHLALEPTDPRGHALLGVVLQARGDLPGAQRSLERALYLDPDREEIIAHLILIHERLGDPARARALSRRAERVRSRRTGP